MFFYKNIYKLYNCLQPTYADTFSHGGHDSESSHIFYYKNYIHFFGGITVRHIYVTNKKRAKKSFSRLTV